MSRKEAFEACKLVKFPEGWRSSSWNYCVHALPPHEEGTIFIPGHIVLHALGVYAGYVDVSVDGVTIRCHYTQVQAAVDHGRAWYKEPR